MTATIQTPIRGTTPLTASKAVDFAKSKGAKANFIAYIFGIWEFAPVFGLNPAVVFAQWLVETDYGRSPRWLNGDPAGIGIFADSTPSTLPEGLSGRQSAAIHVVELAMKVLKDPSIHEVGGIDVAKIDPHLERVKTFVSNPGWPTVSVVQDLNKKLTFGSGDFVWAENQGNGLEMARRLNEFAAFAGGTSPVDLEGIVFGRVKHPPFIDRLIPDNENGAWDDLGEPNIVGVCGHSMIGSLWGTDRWFRRGPNTSTESNGLTHYGIGGSTDGPEWDGVIIRWNDPRGKSHDVDYSDSNGRRHRGRVSPRRAGWANGGSDGLEGDGPNFVRRLGISAINRDLVSIERSDGGVLSTPMSPKQFESICALSAYWFDQAHIPWHEFPLDSALGIVTHLLHFEFATKACPFEPVISRINEIQNRIRAILKAGQVQVITPPEIPPVKPPTPSHDWPNGWTDATLKKRWHSPVKVALDGRLVTAKFSPTSDLVNAWVARGVEKDYTNVNQLPIPTTWFQERGPDRGQVMSTVTFNGPGAHNWILFRQDDRASWRWIDLE